MNINIKRQKTPINIERRNKLNMIEDNDSGVKTHIGFDWIAKAEDVEEQKSILKNMHLFCISITRDLLKNRFKTNEIGELKYNISDDIKTDDVVYALESLEKSILESEK
jgi:hypothetical protein